MRKAFNRAINFTIHGVSPVAVALFLGSALLASSAACSVAWWINPRSLVVVAPLCLAGTAWWMWEHR